MDEMKSEIRTLQKVGSSLALYLPKEWCEANSISKGSKVTVRYKDDLLCIDIEEVGRVRSKSIVFDITFIPEDELKYLITSFYIIGYERVKLVSTKKISLMLRRLILSVLRYTPKYTVIEEGENYMIIGEIGGVEDVLEALKREFNSVATVFKYTIEAFESDPNALSDYYESINELDDDVDRAQVEVERSAYKLVEKPLASMERVRYIISAAAISTLLERLSDHLVLLVKEASEGFPSSGKVLTYLQESNKVYKTLFDVVERVMRGEYDASKISPTLSSLIHIIERKRLIRENISKTTYEKGYELVTYHIIRIYGIIADIAEVLVNLLTSLYMGKA